MFFGAFLAFSQRPEMLPKDHPAIQPKGKLAEASRLTSEIAGKASAPSLPIPRRNLIDEHIFSRMEKARIPPAPLADDHEFFRRVNLDLTGRLPEPADTEKFVQSKDPAKRDKLVEALIQSPGFLAKWTYWFSDLAQVNSNRLGTDGRNLFYQYIYDFLHLDRPYDEVVTEMLTAKAASNYYVGPASYLVRWVVIGDKCEDEVHEDTSDEIAIWTAKHFLGVNLQCISCHDGKRHLEKINLGLAERKRSELWKQAAFFGKTRILRRTEIATTRDEYSIDDKGHGYDAGGRSVVRIPRGAKGPVEPEFFLTGEKPQPGKPLREEFARMVTTNPQFARATVNMFWAEMMGAGIVDPVDEFDFGRLPESTIPAGWTVQASHPELLEALAADFRKNGHSIKRLFRLIAQSSAYQLSSKYPGEWKDSYARYFARKFVRRLTSEELHDAIVKATGVYHDIPVPNRGITVKFATEARSPEDFRKLRDVNFFLESFGQPNRDYSQRSNEGAISQAVLLMNSPLVKNKIRALPGSHLESLLDARPPLGDDRIVRNLFLRFLVREPDETESVMSRQLLARDRLRGAEDLQWLLVNKIEFVFNY
jgi:hypothetical protein